MQIIVQHFRQPQARGGILQDNSKIIPIKLKLLVKLSRALLSFHSTLLISSSFTSCSIRNHGQCFILHNSVPGSFFLNISVSWSDSSESELWLAACKVHLTLAANVKKNMFEWLNSQWAPFVPSLDWRPVHSQPCDRGMLWQVPKWEINPTWISKKWKRIHRTKGHSANRSSRKSLKVLLSELAVKVLPAGRTWFGAELLKSQSILIFG